MKIKMSKFILINLLDSDETILQPNSIYFPGERLCNCMYLLWEMNLIYLTCRHLNGLT